MIFKEDISKRIKSDFGEASDKAFKVLNDAVEIINYIETDRIIRCIIFLAAGNVEALNKYIDAAIIDARDVMLWAEYEYSGGGDFNYKRLHDFNKTF
jgi:hypothetical protein